MDSAVGIPGTPWRIGLDAFLGLIPGAGDAIGAALSGYILLAAARKGAPTAVLGRMLANVLIDTALGAIPVVGDLFDVGYKSNLRNVALLEQFTARPREVTRGSRLLAIVTAGVLLLALAGIVVGAVSVARLVWRLLGG